MKRKPSEFQKTYSRLKAWRERLRGGGKNRKNRDTPFKEEIAPQKGGEAKGEG